MTNKEAIEILKGAIKKPNTKDGYLGQALTMGIEALENQKTGHWISKPNIYGVVYCSECDYELHTNNTNFCANCGAKMEGEDIE